MTSSSRFAMSAQSSELTRANPRVARSRRLWSSANSARTWPANAAMSPFGTARKASPQTSLSSGRSERDHRQAQRHRFAYHNRPILPVRGMKKQPCGSESGECFGGVEDQPQEVNVALETECAYTRLGRLHVNAATDDGELGVGFCSHDARPHLDEREDPLLSRDAHDGRRVIP